MLGTPNCLQSGLPVQPEKACVFKAACMILHNIAKMLDEEEFNGDDEEDFECDLLPQTEDSSDGKVVRNHIT